MQLVQTQIRFVAPVGQYGAYALQIRIPTFNRNIVGVRNLAALLVTFVANFDKF